MKTKIFLGSAALILLLIAVFITANWKRDLKLEELKPKYANAQSRFLEIDGMPVHYRDEGNAQDTLPLVLLHGTGASLHTWEGWVEALRGERRIIRLDLPAYGLTGPHPEGRYEMVDYARFLLKFLDSLHLQRFILGGNSLGGRIAWSTALQVPGRIAALILVDASGYPVASDSRPLAFRIAGWPGARLIFRYVTPRNVVEGSVRNVYANQDLVTAELIDRYYDLALREGNRKAFIDRMSGGKEWSDNYEEIGSIKAPTLILWGREDKLIPVAAAEQFHADLPNDTLVILDGIGHVPMEEDAERTVAVVRDFLKRL